MVRQRILFLILTIAFTAIVPSNASQGDCPIVVAATGCPSVSGSTDGSTVTLTGDEAIPGSPGGSTSVVSAPSAPPKVFGKTCRIQPELPACNPPQTEGAAPLTMSDIASFRPAPGRQQMQPDGWTIAGLDTNFYAIIGQQVVNGTLLGRPADVRFTPTTYRWAYGDGTSATLGTPGGTWEELGVDEFDPTPTSHVYEHVGDYTITLTIVFRAEYRYAGGAWRPVVGTLALPANDLHIHVGTAKTVLVEQDCAQNPAGPGC